MNEMNCNCEGCDGTAMPHSDFCFTCRGAGCDGGPCNKPQSVDIAGLHVYVRDELFAGEVDEFGRPAEELAFQIVIENARGDRWASTWAVTTKRYSRAVCTRLANKRLAVVVAAVRKGARPEGSAKWELTYPVYGSEAYVKYGQAEERAWERSVEGE